MTSTFEWKLKNKQLKEQGLDPHKSEEQRREELMEEIQKVKARREERERLRLEREAERLREAREREMQHWDEWERKEAEVGLSHTRLLFIVFLF